MHDSDHTHQLFRLRANFFGFLVFQLTSLQVFQQIYNIWYLMLACKFVIDLYLECNSMYIVQLVWLISKCYIINELEIPCSCVIKAEIIADDSQLELMPTVK